MYPKAPLLCYPSDQKKSKNEKTKPANGRAAERAKQDCAHFSKEAAFPWPCLGFLLRDAERLEQLDLKTKMLPISLCMRTLVWH